MGGVFERVLPTSGYLRFRWRRSCVGSRRWNESIAKLHFAMCSGRTATDNQNITASSGEATTCGGSPVGASDDAGACRPENILFRRREDDVLFASNGAAGSPSGIDHRAAFTTSTALEFIDRSDRVASRCYRQNARAFSTREAAYTRGERGNALDRWGRRYARGVDGSICRTRWRT